MRAGIDKLNNHMPRTKKNNKKLGVDENPEVTVYVLQENENNELVAEENQEAIINETTQDENTNEEVFEHIVSEQDIELNPELSKVISVGDKIEIPVEDEVIEDETSILEQNENTEEATAEDNIEEEQNPITATSNDELKTFRGKKVIAISDVLINGKRYTKLNLNDEEVIL